MMMALRQNHSAPDVIAARLKAGETLLWSATPDLRFVRIPWLRLVAAALFFGASALLIYAGAIATLVAVRQQGASGLGGLLIVALAIPARVAHDAYALTDLRLMIANSAFGSDFREIAIESVCGIQRWERRGGHAAFELEDNRQANRELVLRAFLFDGIADADELEALLSHVTRVAVTSKRNARRYARVQGRGADARLPG
jgi:hypothetical protein